MGMFDRIWITCPQCGTSVEEQSKAGPCSLKDYTLDDAPNSVLGDIIGNSVICPECKSTIKISVKVIAFPILERCTE